MRSVHRRAAIGVGLGALASAGGCGSAHGLGYPGPMPRLGRGINLHQLFNWPDMDAPGRYRWPPFQGDGRRMSSQQLADLRAEGFETLRVTADPAIYLTADADGRTQLRDAYLRQLRAMLEAGFASVVFDLHPVRQNPAYSAVALAAADAPVDRYAQMLRELAAALATLPAGKIALELFNEPPLWRAEDIDRWSATLVRLHAAARAGSPWLPLVLGGARWGQLRGLTELDPRPYAGSNVIYTFHYYAPHVFTHQTVPPGIERYVGGLTWPPVRDRKEAVWQAAQARIAADGALSPEARARTSADVKRQLDEFFDIRDADAYIAKDFRAAAAWARAHRIPPGRIFVGEFGACREAPETSPQSRFDWLRSVRSNAERRGFSWALWAYSGSGMAMMGPGGPDPLILKALALKRPATVAH